MTKPDDPENLEALVHRLQDFANRWPEISAPKDHDKERARAEAEAHIDRRFAEHTARLAKLARKT